MVISFKQRLFYFFPTLFCFCLPFGSGFSNETRVLSLIIILWIIVSLFNIDKQQLLVGLKNKNALLLYLFFLLTFLSSLFSKNKSAASFEVESKLSFILLPYLLFCFNIPIQIFKRFIVSFVSGCFFASLFLILRAFYFALNGQQDYFFYTKFSAFIHASYFSMYLILAIIFMVLFYHKWFQKQKNVMIMSYIFLLIFGITIFLCQSKLGLISFVIIIPVLILYKLNWLLNVKKIAIVLGSLIILLIALSKLFPVAFERLNSISSLNVNQLDKTSSESTAVRFLVWKQSLKIIEHNFLFGTTVGDANETLYKAYEQSGMTGALEHKLNAHNQFLQTFIGLGLLGFVVLWLLTFWQMIKAIIKKNFLLLLFSFLITLNFLVESMLQAMAGTLFFVFFFCMFNLVNKKQLLDE